MRRRSRPEDTSYGGSGKATSSPVVRGVAIMTVSTVMVADKAGTRMLLVRCSVSDIFGVEGEVGGIGQEAFSVAPAHVSTHGNDRNDKNSQSSQPKNKPSEGFILEEGLSLGFGGSG